METRHLQTEADSARHEIDVLVNERRNAFPVARSLVLKGFAKLTRAFPNKVREWRRWKNQWVVHLAEASGMWDVAERYLKRAIADRTVTGASRMAAYAALGRVLARLRKASSPERLGVLRTALRLGLRHPDPTLFSVLMQLEEMGRLTWTGPTRAAFRHLVTRCLRPARQVPRNVHEMGKLAREWRRKCG